MKIVCLLSILFLLISCDPKEENKPEPKPPVSPPVVTPLPTPPPTTKIDLRKEINKVVESSTSCSDYKWKDRSVAPRAYVNGIALMYAKQVCGQGTDFIKTDKIRTTWYYNGKNITHDDALEHYGIKGSELNTYTLLLGLGMRESSGRYGAGRDLSQDFTKSVTAEAGIFQMSYNAKLFNKELNPLYFEFKKGTRSCELETFKDARTSVQKSHESKDYGTGEGAAWQI